MSLWSALCIYSLQNPAAALAAAIPGAGKQEAEGRLSPPPTPGLLGDS